VDVCVVFQQALLRGVVKVRAMVDGGNFGQRAAKDFGLPCVTIYFLFSFDMGLYVYIYIYIYIYQQERTVNGQDSLYIGKGAWWREEIGY
jgi:hypothetical protein